jgi:ketosteroid isomerase-like protein
MLATLVLTAALAAPPAAADTTPAAESPDIAAVRKQDDALQAAHGRGDMATYRAGLSAHYVYIDIGGKRVTADLLDRRREADQRRLVSSESLEEEAVQLSDTAVLLRGHERSLSVYYGGLPRVGETRWTALWVKEADGIWRLTAETATPVRKHEGLPFVAEPQPRAVLDSLAGDWVLATTPRLSLNLRAVDDGLVARLHGQSLDWTFQPASARHFFAMERPFELRISADGQHLEMTTWGTATKATRAAPIQDGGR